MKKSYCLAAILLGTTLMGTSLNETAALQKGESSSTALVQKLGSELKAVMQKDGPVEAVNFCSKNAISLTHEVSKAHGVKMKRVTLQQRNPLNRPTPEEIEVMNTWMSAMAKGEQPTAVLSKATAGFTYYKPLVINNDVCLKCHGTVDSATPLGQALKASYPADRATGYKMGDLRGMVVVDIPQE
ncbi:MAG: DUF3365 domain-containing protein [Sulfuricurvum sp.]|jgi:hypothetical protein|nr:DUF3365 domain-containing protein [Sulfuricurvum sp.]MDP3120424.1 DUF3365 domain-containing protein [Sulfuricurvum sp.]